MLRVGTVPYLVARPLDAGLEDEPGITLERDVPATLVEKLRAGALDVALVSSIELFRRSGYRWIDGIGVASRGPVSSVKVFHRLPVEDVGSIALDPASRTAAALTQVVWPRGGGAAPLIVEVPSGADPAEATADAWLEIGDPALRRQLGGDPPPSLDPARLWREHTGLPFVFAAWIARPDVELEGWTASFARARRRGAELAPELVRVAAEEWSLPHEGVRRYLLEECDYEPGDEMAPSLLSFRDAAARRDLCRADVAPRGVPAWD